MNYDEEVIIREDPAVACLKLVYLCINIFFSVILAFYILKTVFNPPSMLEKLQNLILYIFFFPIYMIKYLFECQHKN
jgi:hypothetical protein